MIQYVVTSKREEDMEENSQPKQQGLLRFLFTHKGNTKPIILTEPLFAIPHSLFIPFAAIFMSALGVTDAQIGLIAAVNLLVQAFAAFIAGAVIDKVGRRRSLFFFDLFCWTIPFIFWIFAQNFWWFLIAASMNGMLQVPFNSWSCQVVEDNKSVDLVKVFSLLHLTSQLAAIFLPFSILLIEGLGIVVAMRIIYSVAFVSTLIKFISLFCLSTEPEQGKKRMAETKNQSIFSLMSGYGSIAKQILTSRALLFALLLNTTFRVTIIILNNVFGLFITDNIGLSESHLVIFAILRALVIIFFLLVVQPRIAQRNYRHPILFGLIFFISSHALLIFSPIEGWTIPVVYVFLEAMAFSLVMPRQSGLFNNLIDPQERARIMCIIVVFSLIISIPFTYLSGWLAEIDRRLPFVLNIGIFAVTFVVSLCAKKLMAPQEQSAGDSTS